MFQSHLASRTLSFLLTAACFAVAQTARADADVSPPSSPVAHDAPATEAGPTAHGRVHDGFYFRGSIGYAGSYDFSTQRSWDGASTSGANYPLGLGYEALFGGTLPNIAGGRGSLVLGGGLEALMSRGSSGGYLDGNPTRVLSTAAPVAFADYYPNARRGLHLQGLAGVAMAFAQCEGPCFSDDTAIGVLGGAGLGYDAWLSDEWSLGLLGRVQYAHLVGNDSHAVHDAVMPTLAVSVVYN